MSFTNPSIEEVKEWAYSGASWPNDEWDLFLSWTEEVSFFIELATDANCPHRRFFLHMLYYVIGTFHGRPRSVEPRQRIASYVDKGRMIKHGDIQQWVRAVDDLLQGKKEYCYEDWRGGKLAGYAFS